MLSKVDKYLRDGCMQCKLGATPACKINKWQEEVKFLRQLVLDCGLQEDFKWMHPCYTSENKNIVLIHVFNDYSALLFPKGVLLKDKKSILIQQTENSQTARQLRFTGLSQIVKLKKTIQEYILEAVQLEKEGVKVKFKETSAFPVPEELESRFEASPAFKKAFYALTPGRQRGYLLHFSQPKQATTRIARIDKNEERIFLGKGLND